MLNIRTTLAPQECVAALKSGTTEETLFGPIGASAGTILRKLNGYRFRLREKRNYRNSFASYFYGEMKPAEGGGTEIVGRFRMHPFVIAFMAVWFGMLILFLMGAMLPATVVHRSQPQAMLLIGPVLMGTFAGGMVWFGWWFSRNERVRITKFLAEAFSSERVAAGLPVPQSPAKPASMTGAILFFGGLGLLSVLGALSGISHAEFATTSPGATHHNITYFSDALSRVLAAVNGGFLILLAYGIWKRLRLAWTMGFAVVAFSAITFVVSVWVDSRIIDQRDSPLVFVLFGSVAGLVVGAYWAYWWYKKRPYFDTRQGRLREVVTPSKSTNSVV